MSFIAWIVLGLIAGFIASKIVNRTGEGFLLDISAEPDLRIGVNLRPGSDVRPAVLPLHRRQKCAVSDP